MIRLLPILLLAGCASAPAPRLTPGEPIMIADTGSMRATFRGPQFRAVIAKSFAELQRGDIALRWDEGRREIVAHRIIARRQTWRGLALVTKGSSNPERDTKVLVPENYLGVILP